MDRTIYLFLSILIATPLFARDPLPKNEAAAIIKEFLYQENHDIIKSRVRKPLFSNCWQYEQTVETEYPQMNEPLEVTQTLYIPNRNSLGNKVIPAVIMIPPIGGVNPLDTQTAKTLCNNDMAAILISNDFANVKYQSEKELLPVEDHQMTYFRVAAAVKAAISQIKDDENLDQDKIGLLGVSLGGILSSFVMATQQEIAAGYFVVAGGDVPEILATSQQEEIAIIRDKRMKEQNLATADDYEDYLRQHITIDPIDISITMMPETLRMVIASEDRNVPTANQWALHRAFGEPENDLLDLGHLDAILNSLLPGKKRREIARFFQMRFAEPNPRPETFDTLDLWSLDLLME